MKRPPIHLRVETPSSYGNENGSFLHGVPHVIGMFLVLFPFLVLCARGAAAWMRPSDLDELVSKIWASEGITPASGCSDAEFLRRVFLDLTGQPPDLVETIRFLQDDSPRKKEKLVDHLLDSREYGVHRATVWMDLIGAGRQEKKRLPVDSFANWFSENFNRDRPFDGMVRDLITARGASEENGATYLIVSHRGKQSNLVGTTTRLFLGTRLECAQCHDDKFDKWKQEDFWGMASFFSRVRIRPDRKMGNRLVSVRVTDLPRGEAFVPEGGILPEPRGLPPEERQKLRRELRMKQRTNPVAPRFMGKAVRLPGSMNRRDVLADLVTDPQNKLFAQTIVNRVWSEMFGRGLIEPVDDIHGKNAGIWKPVLDTLSNEFIRSGHSLKHLYRLIAGSQVYQRTSRGSENDTERVNAFAQSRLRPLSPKVLFATLLKTTGVEKTVEIRFPRQILERQKHRYIEKFVFTFGDDEGNIAEPFEGTIPQALMLMNDAIVHRGTSPLPGSTLHRILKKTEDPEERIRYLYLAVLCREPSVGEKQDCLAFVGHGSQAGPVRPEESERRVGPGVYRVPNVLDPSGVYQDLFWTLLNTTEFLYNH